jgi:hypothetical protein
VKVFVPPAIQKLSRLFFRRQDFQALRQIFSTIRTSPYFKMADDGMLMNFTIGDSVIKPEAKFKGGTWREHCAQLHLRVLSRILGGLSASLQSVGLAMFLL